MIVVLRYVEPLSVCRIARGARLRRQVQPRPTGLVSAVLLLSAPSAALRCVCFFTAEAQRARRDFFTLRSRRLCGAFIFLPLRRRGRREIFFTLRSRRRCGAFAFSPLRRRGRRKDFSLSVLSVAAVHLLFHRRGAEGAERFFSLCVLGGAAVRFTTASILQASFANVPER